MLALLDGAAVVLSAMVVIVMFHLHARDDVMNTTFSPCSGSSWLDVVGLCACHMNTVTVLEDAKWLQRFQKSESQLSSSFPFFYTFSAIG